MKRKFAAAVVLIWLAACAPPLSAAVIGVDAVHGYSPAENLATGSAFDEFRAEFIALGHTLIPLASFAPDDLAGLDAVVLQAPYATNASVYPPHERAAIAAFVEKAVFVSDSSLWNDPHETGSDRPITFSDNRRLLTNAIGFLIGGGVLFVADGGGEFDIASFNALTSPLGVTYATTETDGSGLTVAGFVSHAVTSGIGAVGVDYQLPMTIASPAIDLTLGDGTANILAAYVVPEPSTATLLFIALAVALTVKSRATARGSSGWMRGG